MNIQSYIGGKESRWYGEMTMFRKKGKEMKKTTVDINRAGEIAEQLQVFFQ